MFGWKKGPALPRALKYVQLTTPSLLLQDRPAQYEDAVTWYWDRNCMASRGSCPSSAMPTVTITTTRTATSTSTITRAGTTVTLPASTVTVTASSSSSSSSTSAQSTTSTRSSTPPASTTSSTTTTPDGPQPTFLQILRDASFEQHAASPSDSPWTFNSGASVSQGQAQTGDYKAQLQVNNIVYEMPGQISPSLGSRTYTLSQLSSTPTQEEGVLSFVTGCDANFSGNAFFTIDDVSVLKPRLKCS
ncbi:hypothetical protein BST61_g1130 [Cercospora zeina]